MSKPVFIPLAAGLQTELADQLVQPGATLILENVSHQQTGEAQLRLAADVLATTATPTLPTGGALPTPWQLATLRGSLVRFNRAPVPLHTWAATPERWVRPTNDNGGIASYRKGPIKVDSTPVYSGTQAGDQVSIPDVATSGDVIVEVCETLALSGAATGTMVVIMDRESRTPIYTRRTGAGTRCPKVVIAGGRAIVAYDSGGDLQVDAYSLTTFAVAQTQTFSAVLGTNSPLDVKVGGPVAGATMVHILYVDDAGDNLACTAVLATALGTNSTFTPRTTAGVAIQPDLAFGWLQDFGLSGKHSIMIADTTDGLRVLWDLPAPTAGFSNATATHVLDAGATTAPAGGAAGIRNLIGTTWNSGSGGAYKVLYEVTAPDITTRAIIKVASYLDGEFTLTGTPYRSIGIRSKFWEHEGSYYFLAAFDGEDQRSYFVLAMSADVQPTTTTFPAPLAVSNVRDAGGLTEFVNSPSSAAVGSDGEIFVGVTSETRVESITASGTATGTTMREFAIEVVRVRHPDEAETEVSKPAEMLRSLFVPGGLLGQFDGSTYATAGFPYYPANPGVVVSGTGNLTPSASYFWRFLYSFVDRNGRKWRSAPTAPYGDQTGVTDTLAELSIETLRLYDRGLPSGLGGGFQIEAYRTQANAPDAYFLVATVANDPTTETITIDDNVADTALGEQLYTDGGGVENQLLPPVSCVVEHQGRLVVAEENAGTLWYSVEADFQSGLIFNEALTIDIGDPTEPITGLAVFGQSLFVFKAGKVYAVDGQGNNALGQGATYTARLIGVGVGCSNPQSIVVADDGVWFRSSGSRAGMYRTAGGAPEYVGAGVRAYDGNTITSAVVVGDQTEIRWYSLEGTTLVWNWTTRSWSVNTGQACLSAITGYEPVTGAVYVSASTESFLSEATTSSDDPYREGGVPVFFRASTPWYQAAGIGGWERVKRIQGIGSLGVNSAHRTVINVYKDFRATAFQSVSKVFDGTEEVWDWELRPSQQKVTSFRIEVVIYPYQPEEVTEAIAPSNPEPEYWFESDSGITLGVDTNIAGWGDKTSHNRDVSAGVVGFPQFVANGWAAGIDGVQSTDSVRMDFTGANIFADGDPRTVIAVIRPATEFANIGGYVTAFRRSDRDFALGVYSPSPATTQYFHTNCVDGANNITATVAVDYTGQDLLVVWEFDGTDITTKINGVTIAVNQTVAGTEDGVDTGFSLFGISCSNLASFRGMCAAIVCYALPTAPAGMLAYLSTKYGV